MKTFTATPDNIKRDWYVVDATYKVLGRLATELLPDGELRSDPFVQFLANCRLK